MQFNFEKLLLYKDEQIFKIIESHKNLWLYLTGEYSC